MDPPRDPIPNQMPKNPRLPTPPMSPGERTGSSPEVDDSPRIPAPMPPAQGPNPMPRSKGPTQEPPCCVGSTNRSPRRKDGP
eukprot:scaffold977_cov286-Pavlova_lutheri.AAC.2